MHGWERGKEGRKEGSGGGLEERDMSGVVTTAIAAAVRHSALPLLCLAFPALSSPFLINCLSLAKGHFTHETESP